MFIAHNWVLVTNVLRIDLKRSVSILTCALLFIAMFIAHNWVLATNVVRIDLKRSVSISSCASCYVY